MFCLFIGGWIFLVLLEEVCKIELNLEFEFSNKLVEMVFGKVFNSLVSSMVVVFIDWVWSVYVWVRSLLILRLFMCYLLSKWLLMLLFMKMWW